MMSICSFCTSHEVCHGVGKAIIQTLGSQSRAHSQRESLTMTETAFEGFEPVPSAFPSDHSSQDAHGLSWATSLVVKIF
jgi:hypothetical protein